LVLIGIEGVPPLQLRMTFAMARQILVEMVRSFGVAPSRYSGDDRLDRRRFSQLTQAVREAGFKWENPDPGEGWAALRATYEPLLAAVAAYLLLPLPDGCLERRLPTTGSAARWPIVCSTS
jgi:hypothetical protein